VLDKINASLIPLLFKPFVKFEIAYSPPSPPLGDIYVLSVTPIRVGGIDGKVLGLGCTSLVEESQAHAGRYSRARGGSETVGLSPSGLAVLTKPASSASARGV
jgi:hypothetical protein